MDRAAVMDEGRDAVKAQVTGEARAVVKAMAKGMVRANVVETAEDDKVEAQGVLVEYAESPPMNYRI